ncbi:MAG: hypothetical protein CL472_02705 [Acidobacteria bacterium]|nr:hypothetical protein [Acidobacteriota bacterium]
MVIRIYSNREIIESDDQPNILRMGALMSVMVTVGVIVRMLVFCFTVNHQKHGCDCCEEGVFHFNSVFVSS